MRAVVHETALRKPRLAPGPGTCRVERENDMRRTIFAIAVGFGLLAPTIASSQVVVQSRGVDSRVDYASLVEYGPWDDRNYSLSEDDLALLGANELDLSVQIPLFYRVQLRKENPGMLRSGPVQYPRSALPRFFIEYGGFLIDGNLYRDVRRVDGQLTVDLSKAAAMTKEQFTASKALEGDVRVTSPTGAAESAIAINPANPDRVIAGSNGPGYGQIMHYSNDGGESWQQATALPLGNTCCDPTVAWSSDGTKAYTVTLGSGVWFYRSGDNGETWNDLVNEPGSDPRREFGIYYSDKEYLHVDLAPGSSCLDTLYVTWHEDGTMKFARSSDRGHTWSSPATLSSGSNQLGIGSDITSDKDGNVYYVWPAYGPRKIWVRKSTDCGANFDSVVEVATSVAAYDFPIPSMDTRNVFLYISAASDLSDGPYGGSLYVSWTDSTDPTSGTPSNNHARIQVSYSRDGGSTWAAATTPHETDDAATVDRWHQWLAVGPDGTVHVVFYDTRRDPSRQSVDLFWSTSTDGAVTWSDPIRLTSEQSPSINDGFEFGDYNGMDVVMNDLIAIFTDNRNEGGGEATPSMCTLPVASSSCLSRRSLPTVSKLEIPRRGPQQHHNIMRGNDSKPGFGRVFWGHSQTARQPSCCRLFVLSYQRSQANHLIERQVVGAVDLANPASADVGDDPVPFVQDLPGPKSVPFL